MATGATFAGLLIIATLVALSASAVAATSEKGGGCLVCRVPMANSENNLYMAWPNNDTGHWNVLFAKSTVGGKTLKTMVISALNKGNVVDQNTQISTSGRWQMSMSYGVSVL